MAIGKSISEGDHEFKTIVAVAFFVKVFALNQLIVYRNFDKKKSLVSIIQFFFNHKRELNIHISLNSLKS